MYEFKQDISKLMETEDVEYIEIKCDNKEDYYRILDEMVKFNRNAIKVSGVSKTGYRLLIEHFEDELNNATDVDEIESEEGKNNE